MKEEDYINKKYGKLTILSFAEPTIYFYKSQMKVYKVNCICDCGNLHTTDLQCLKRGKGISCGCWNKESAKIRATKHGLSQVNKKTTSTYMIWTHVKGRCLNEKNKDYKDYGGRGITMSEEWKESYLNFYNDMGEKPKGFSIERINVDGNYCKENCKWISKRDQNKNKRNNQIHYNGEIKCLSDWCKILNLSYGSMRHRIYDLKMSMEEAIIIPKNKTIKVVLGERVNGSKLKEKDVIDILTSKLSRTELAIKYNVGRQNIDSIINRKTWKHIIV